MAVEEKQYDFVIVGAGISGSIAAFFLSKQSKCLLIDEHSSPAPYNLIKVMPAHDFTFVPEIPKDDTDIFPADHCTTIYASNSLESSLDSMEFGKVFGKMMNQYYFNKWFQDQAQQNGIEFGWNQKVTKVEIKNEGITLFLESTSNEFSEQTTIDAQVLLLATGSTGFELQKSLGFSVPTPYNLIILGAEGDSEQIKQNIPFDYKFQLHPKISTDGPLAITRGSNSFNVGFISKETPAQMIEKFIRILRNYKPLEGIFTGTNKNPETLSGLDFSIGKCSKNPIPIKSKNRVLVIGEATGLVTPVYFEGILGCIASAKVASELLLQLKDQNSQFTAQDLRKYDELLQRAIRNYWKSNEASDLLFMKSGSNQMTIWNSYLECMQKYPKLREYIHNAYLCEDLKNYPLKNDEWSGTQIYNNLPLAQKLLLSPLFLKVKLS
jgi:flavin-dependent dehydrogenase